MTLRLHPGNALICNVNSHRHGWNGDICTNAADWDCGTKLEFREDKCEYGIPLCFHLNLFHPPSIRFQADMNGIDWVLEGREDQLDDQILLFTYRASREPSGIVSHERTLAAGAYRVRGADRENPFVWNIHPHPDGWTRFPKMEIEAPNSGYANGKYVRYVEQRLVKKLFSDLATKIQQDEPAWHDPGDRDRFEQFYMELPAWLEAATEKRRAWLDANLKGTTYSFGPGSAPASSPFDILKGRIPLAPEPAEAPAAPAAPEPEVSDRPSPLIEDEQYRWIAETHDEGVARAIAIGAASKPLLVLRGPTGVGKSHLARHLVTEERFILVPVGATWRGREDLLGYVNPVNGEFEATPFTRFLERAARAWGEGDRTPWLVVFDEFNLSQPEHWLADVLSLSQAEDDSQRMIELGGSGFLPAGAKERVTRVLLSRAVRFIATINNDHTVLPLSPRVLDRSSLVEIPLGPTEALARAGIELDETQTGVIVDLDYELRERGTTFSIRTALSLREALAECERWNTDPWVVLDHVLAQEVLSKLRLHAGDAGDLDLLGRLEKWRDAESENRLGRCTELLVNWRRLLDKGIDVVQA